MSFDWHAVVTKLCVESVVLQSAVTPSKGCQLTTLAWFDRRFKNHWLLTGVVGIHCI